MKCKEKNNNMPAYRPLLGINESYSGGSRIVEQKKIKPNDLSLNSCQEKLQ